MRLMGRMSKKCDYCGTNGSTRKIELNDGHSRSVCENCWRTKRVVPYLYPRGYLLDERLAA